MPLKLCVLASGSSGNCTFVGTESTRILIDAGLSARRTAERLEVIGESVGRINAICVSHEHADHIAGIRVLQKNHGIPVYANAGTFQALGGELQGKRFETGSPFTIGDLRIEPFSVSHDALDPVGFVVKAGVRAVGVATDVGIVTNLLREKLRTCQAVIIEANHDEEMLRNASRPWSLIQRIMGRQGHLSNASAAGLIADIAGETLEHLFLAHLSADCNSPRHARRTVEAALAKAGHRHVTVRLTAADAVSDVLELE